MHCDSSLFGFPLSASRSGIQQTRAPSGLASPAYAAIYGRKYLIRGHAVDWGKKNDRVLTFVKRRSLNFFFLVVQFHLIYLPSNNNPRIFICKSPTVSACRNQTGLEDYETPSRSLYHRHPPLSAKLSFFLHTG